MLARRLLDDLPSLEKVLGAVKKALSIPLTIKIRTGFRNRALTYNQVIQLAQDCGVAAVAIHGRTREQAYEGRANWDLIADAKRRASIPNHRQRRFGGCAASYRLLAAEAAVMAS